MRLFNGMGRMLRGTGLLTIDPDRLISAAIRRVGADDFGAGEFREGLTVFAESLESEAQMNLIGRITARTMLLGSLEARLGIEAHRAANPEVAERGIDRPIFIVGLPRTGTTALFNLLAQDRANRAPLAWEVTYPAPPPETATYESDKRIRKGNRDFDRLNKMIPTLPAIHMMAGQLPQECPPIHALAMHSMQFHVMFRVPTYQAWYEQQSMGPADDAQRRFLQHLQSGHMSERWLLKSPAHLPYIDDLLTAFPDALIIHTHRDPARTLPSIASMYFALRGLGSDHIDAFDTGRAVMEVWTKATALAVDARRRHSDRGHQFFDAPFADIVADPVGLLARAYAHFGIELSDESAARMHAFMEANPRGSKGKHRYTLEDFGMDLDEIRGRFERYCEKFSVPLGTEKA